MKLVVWIAGRAISFFFKLVSVGAIRLPDNPKGRMASKDGVNPIKGWSSHFNSINDNLLFMQVRKPSLATS